MKLVFWFTCLVLTACSAPDSAKNAPPGDPPQKLLQKCVPLREVIDSTLGKDPDISTSLSLLHDGKCAIQLNLIWPADAISKLSKIKERLGSYTHFSQLNEAGETEFVTLWLMEPRNMWIPVLDPDTGKKLSTLETKEECETSASRLREHFQDAQVLTRWLPDDPYRLCYVDLIFAAEEDFEKFFAWQNPYTLDGALLQMHYQRSTGVIATVEIRPLSGR